MPRALRKIRPRTGVRVGALALAALSVPACTQILGLDDLDYEPKDGGTAVAPGSDATAPPDAPSPGTDAGSLDSEPPEDAPPGDAPSLPTPVTIATSPSGAGAVQGMAIDDTRLYWVTAGSEGYVLSVLKDGGGAATIAKTQPYPLDVAVLGTSVYWSVVPGGPGPQCMAMVAGIPGSAPDGGDAGPECVTSSPDTTVRMTLGGGGVVLLAQGTGATVNDEYIGFATTGSAYTNVATQGPSQAVTATTQQGFLGNKNGFHVDEIAFPGLTYGPSVCTSNCGGTVIEDMTLDVTAQNVLWVTEGGGVHSASIHVNGAVGIQFVVLAGTPQRLARDANYVYVTTSGTSVFAVPTGQGPDGGVFLTLSKEENAPFGIVTDGVDVYWGGADGTIRSVPVPPP